MATPSEIITLINNEITSNGNNEITAEVLRPVLTAMVNQINDLVGSADNLPSGETNVIDALNSIAPQNIQIHTGTADPNITPPSSFGLGDFYSQTLSSVIIAFWQYNGILWTEILSREEQKLRTTYFIAGNLDIRSYDDTVIYNGTNTSDTLGLPSASLNKGKVLTIANVSDVQINIGSYLDLSEGLNDTLASNKVLKVHSTGTVWQQINN